MELCDKDASGSVAATMVMYTVAGPLTLCQHHYMECWKQAKATGYAYIAMPLDPPASMVPGFFREDWPSEPTYRLYAAMRLTPDAP